MAVAHITFTSKELKMNTSVVVCFPDSVRMDGVPLSKRKVLYLLHGLSDDCSSWLRYSRIDKYCMDTGLVAVMPSADRSMYCDNVNGQNYFSYIADELPEYLSEVFGLSRAKEDNFIAGLSMGGMGAMKIALTYPERYAAVGSFSGVLDLRPMAAMVNDDMKREFPFLVSEIPNIDSSPLNPTFLLDAHRDKDLKIYVACGYQDNMYIPNCLFCERIEEIGIEAKVTFENGKHDWDFWERHIPLFIDFILR